MNTDKQSQLLEEGQHAAIYPEQELTGRILSAAFAVHNTLGSGFLERVYANALLVELRTEGFECTQGAPLKVKYRGAIVRDYVADLVVAGRVLIEMKACAVLDANHSAQIMNYLRASGIHVGLLLNFGRPKLEYRRFIC
jgi:GxxExxY protein